ncbi:hypothetical protein N7444_001437 [Penicillium canescens]|nr:hypothetical protein N7444_001437 [Penicillium canescens]
MISLLVQENLVSRGLMQYKQLTDWRKAGSKYLALANELGGWGALVFLPALARTDYESHYHPTSKDMTKEHQRRIIIQRLREKVPQAASRERRGGRNAYEVVEALREHWRSKFSTIILDCDLYGRQETSTTLNCRQYDPTTKPYRFRQSRIAKQTSHPRTPLPAMGEDVPLWQAPSSIVQSPWGDSELTPDGASTTQLSFPTSNDDDCRRVFPSSSSMPLVI